MDDDCRPQRAMLAEGPFCKVEACGCGTIHVSLGPITLRLRVDVVESVVQTLSEALRMLGRTGSDKHARAEGSDKYARAEGSDKSARADERLTRN